MIDTLRNVVTNAVAGVSPHGRPQAHMMALGIVALGSALLDLGYEPGVLVAVAEAHDHDDPVAAALRAVEQDEADRAAA